jgi:hypothetical protein
MVLEEALVLDKKLDFGMNLILLAGHNSGKMVHKKIVALIIVINHPSIQELFAAAGIKTSTASPTEELETTAMPDVDSPILPQVLFQERTSGDQKRTTEPVEEECIQIYQNRRAKKEQ